MHTPNVGVSPVYLIHPNALLAKDTALQIAQLGYPVVVLTALPELATAIARQVPAAVVIDLGKTIATAQMAVELARLRQQNRFALLFLSSRGNFESRLSAVRAGADAYLTRPVDMVMLGEKIDVLLRRLDHKPYRVLLVSNDTQHEKILREAAMDVTVLCRPGDLFNQLGECQAEIVLIGVLLPECNGIDMTRLIRLDGHYLDIPIVCMGREPNDGEHLQSLDAGADDYLGSAISPTHLIAAVTARAERYRSLRGLILRDSLTGLYNHAAIKEYLVQEMSVIERHTVPLSMAMIDLDFFKKVNDTYGHPMGDQVIRTLSRLLQQRLRRGDIIGRYGGEEFVVVMPATTLEAAVAVLSDIGAVFAQIRHYADNIGFSVTFSAGVAEAYGHSDAKSLLASADAALYEAKDAGRNRIVACRTA
ncbi:MAG: diguanylate cyclase [Herminiimonas sp.]|nr:diguanylate cyclase [Herminiimonas sp.]